MSARWRGFTLVELIVLIVVLGTTLAGVMLLFQNAVRSSADPQIYKQALSVAEAMLDEVLLTSYDPQPGSGSRANFDDVDDYNTFSTTGVRDLQGNPIPGLEGYNVSVAVAAQGIGPGGLAVGESKRVTVTVTFAADTNFAVSVDGYRLRYALP